MSDTALISAAVARLHNDAKSQLDLTIALLDSARIMAPMDPRVEEAKHHILSAGASLSRAIKAMDS